MKDAVLSNVMPSSEFSRPRNRVKVGLNSEVTVSIVPRSVTRCVKLFSSTNSRLDALKPSTSTPVTKKL